MKYVLVWSLILAILHSSYSEDLMKEAQISCGKEYPVPEAVTNKLLNHELVEDESLKDYTFCLYRTIGFQQPDGTFSPESMRAVAHSLKGDHALESLIVHCASSPTKSGGENAWLWLMCMKQTMNPNMFYALCNRFWGFKM